MSFLSRILMRAAREVSQNPEVRAKASEVYEEDVKPKAKQAWQESQPKMKQAWQDSQPKMKQAWQDSQPKIKEAKKDFLRWTLKVRDEYRKGRDGE